MSRMTQSLANLISKMHAESIKIPQAPQCTLDTQSTTFTKLYPCRVRSVWIYNMIVRRQYLPEWIPLPGSGSGVSGVCVWTGLGSGSDHRPLAVTPCRSRLILARPGEDACVLCSVLGAAVLTHCPVLVSAAALFLLRDTWPALTWSSPHLPLTARSRPGSPSCVRVKLQLTAGGCHYEPPCAQVSGEQR